jgi:hypothetical protein
MILTSQVSVCAGADVMSMWASFVSGALTAPIYLGIHHAMVWIEGGFALARRLDTVHACGLPLPLEMPVRFGVVFVQQSPDNNKSRQEVLDKTHRTYFLLHILHYGIK